MVDEKLPFWEHILVLQKYLVWGGAIFIACAALIFAYSDDIVARFLLKPLHGQHLVFLSPLGPLLFEMRIAFTGAFIVCFPIWLFLLLRFVGDVLSRQKQIVFLLVIVVATLLGLGSIFLSYTYLVPLSLAALAHFIVTGTSLMLTAESYLSFVLLSMTASFFILELPVVIIALSYLRVLNPHTLAKQRRPLFLGLLVFLAILTPTTDAATLLILSVPAMILSEVGLIFAKRLYTRETHGHL